MQAHRRLLNLVLVLILLHFDYKTSCQHEQDADSNSIQIEDDDGDGGGDGDGESAFYSRPPDYLPPSPSAADARRKLPGKGQLADLTLLTISSGLTTEPLARFVRTAHFNGFREGIDLRVIDSGRRSNIKADGQYNDWPLLSDSTKLKLLRKAIKVLADKAKDSVILYVDSEASLMLGSSEQILDAFKATQANILLSVSAENTCAFYKDQNKNRTSGSYTGPHLINYDGFIGYAGVLNELLQHPSLAHVSKFKDVINTVYNEDDHESLRSSLKMKLDSNSTIFYTLKSTDYRDSTNVRLDMNLHGSLIKPRLMKVGPRLYNTKAKPKTTGPVLIVQANVCEYQAVMPNAILNYYGNYLTPTLPQDKITLDSGNSNSWPTITMAIFIEKPTPFMEEFFIDLDNLNYDRSRIHLFIHNHFKYNVPDVEAFLDRSGSKYASVKYIRSRERVKEWAARKLGVAHALEMGTDYYFSLDGKAHLENRDTLKLLVESNKLIVAPLLCYITTSTADLQSVSKNFCNFYGTVDSHGLFTKSIDYKNIATSQHFGIWNVPFVSAAYLINATLLRNPDTRPNFVHGFDDAEIAFATNNRNRGLYMYITNEQEYGHLVNTDYFEIHHKHNEMYQIYDNRFDWEKRYLHPNYYDVLPEKDYDGKNHKPLQPCQDVFWFPIVTERFAKEMIEEMERHGGWADGSIEARGDPYPTVDIQMSEIGFDWHWHEFMRLYIKPLQELVFNGYEVYPPKTDQAFVVKYSAIDQRELKPHFDLSTYTINIALNTPKKDFEGGGCRFLRNNCSVVDTKIGWMMMHPGQLTHKHEGLKITSGTRYILVAFIDP